MNIRWMIRRDMPQIVAIEQQCFEFLWDEETFIRCLRQRNIIGMVIEPDVKTHKGRSNDINEPAGYMIYELHRNRLHLLNFATHPDYQRQGYGTALMDKLKSKLYPDANRRNRLMLEVRESNLVAQQFFRACGLRATHVLRNYFEESNEDAYLMLWRCHEAVHAG